MVKTQNVVVKRKHCTCYPCSVGFPAYCYVRSKMKHLLWAIVVLLCFTMSAASYTFWEFQRNSFALMRFCVESNGIFDGSTSSCAIPHGARRGKGEAL